MRTRLALALALVSTGAAGSILTPWSAAAQSTANVTVAETGGIRRTNFPIRAHLEVPAGRLAYATHVALLDGGSAVAAQGTAVSIWPDGSVQGLDVDFNLSLDPMETKRLELRYGADVTPEAPGGRGLLAVTEDADAIQAGSIRFNRTGAPLLLSVDYRNELIVPGGNGLAMTDDAGVRHDASEIVWNSVDVLKPGPLAVEVRYEGRLDLGGGGRVGVQLDLEMPNSKSWLKMSALVSDPGRRVREIAIETPIGLADYPWTWDFATPNGTYGAFRDETASVTFTETAEGSGRTSWQVLAGAVGDERPYEQSVPGRSEAVRGWAHLQSATEAVAFVIEGVEDRAGTLRVTLNGAGQTSFGFAPADPETEHMLTLYQHYVSVPVAIGAATSPASILSPPQVIVTP